jgi:sugar lactone lactonase YvrE
MEKRLPALLVRRHIGFAIVGIMIFLGGCAAPERKIPDIVWPLPPDPPKIKFVDKIADTRELGWESGITETIFGEERATAFTKPYGVAAGRDGKIYVTDIGRVWVLDTKNKKVGFIGVEPGTGRLSFPIGITVSDDGRVFVSDIVKQRVFVYADGKFVSAIGKTGEFVAPTGVAIDEARKLIYVVDSKKHMVGVYSLDNYQGLRTIGKRGTGDGEFNYPTNVAVDQQGRVYVVDTGNFRVVVFDENGKYLKSIGRLGDSPGSMARPKGIAIDSEGNIYVVDAAFDNFQIFNYDGALLLYVGGAGNEPGKFFLPAGMTIDKDDKIYVIDQIPPSLQIFQYMGKKWQERQTAQ